MPIAETEALTLGYRWRTEEPYEPGEIAQMPDLLSSVSDQVLEQKFRCVSTKRLFTLPPQELAFHRRINIALPKFSPLERLSIRAKMLDISDDSLLR